jgi:tripartite-type tricarboxylate transporter receptor subunit TctC
MKNLLTLLAAALACVASGAGAQSYPAKQIRIVIGFPAGGPIDIVARMMSPKLGEAMGQSVIIDNRGGAGGTIGVDNVAKSVPDGYALIMTSTSLAIYPHVYPKLPFDLFRDFAPISVVSNTPELLTIHPSLPVKNVKELIALARARPGQLNGASTGNGGIAHLVIELFKMETGTNITHVPYGGAAPAVTATIGGHSQLLAADLPVLLPHVQSGKLRALFVTVGQRAALLPDVPSAVEAGVAKVEALNWYGLFFPAKTPRDIVDKMNSGIHKALADKDLRERLIARGAEPAPGTPEQLAAQLKNDHAKWGAVVRAAGVKLD